MSGKQAFVALVAGAALVVLGAVSAVASDHDRGEGRDRGGTASIRLTTPKSSAILPPPCLSVSFRDRTAPGT
jgi:hypothetical protein